MCIFVRCHHILQNALNLSQTKAKIILLSDWIPVFKFQLVYANRVLSTGGLEGKAPPPPNVSSSSQKKLFLKKHLKLFQILTLSDDDIKESVNLTIAQICNFSQS